MIGNDVVDLILAKKESNWQRKGFLDKIFTKKEQNLILNNGNPELMVWNLWTRKEAAYKIWNRESEIKAFNPSRFECFDIEEKLGIVEAFGKIYYTQTIANSNFIYTIGLKNKEQFLKIQSLNRTDIIKVDGVPYLNCNVNKKVIISITNHGRFEKIIMI